MHDARPWEVAAAKWLGRWNPPLLAGAAFGLAYSGRLLEAMLTLLLLVPSWMLRRLLFPGGVE